MHYNSRPDIYQLAKGVKYTKNIKFLNKALVFINTNFKLVDLIIEYILVSIFFFN